jgi:hypothetical protein
VTVIGTVREIKDNEYRVGLVPGGVKALGSLPLLTPMSEVARRMAIQVGARYLERVHGGRGILLGGVPGVPPAEVIIVGGGGVGMNAAKMALGLGARVSILDKSVAKMQYIDDVFGGRVATVMSNPVRARAAGGSVARFGRQHLRRPSDVSAGRRGPGRPGVLPARCDGPEAGADDPIIRSEADPILGPPNEGVLGGSRARCRRASREVPP